MLKIKGCDVPFIISEGCIELAWILTRTSPAWGIGTGSWVSERMGGCIIMGGEESFGGGVSWGADIVYGMGRGRIGDCAILWSWLNV